MQSENDYIPQIETAEKNFIILTGRANLKLAKEIGEILGKKVNEPVSSFSDGEIRIKGIPNLRRRRVFIIQPTSSPVNDHIMELLLMIDAAKRASAREINAIIPYFGYSRQDRKEMARVPISASLVSSIIEHAGADRILTLDLHSEQLEGFIKEPWDNLYGSYSLVPIIKSRDLKNIVVASPDKGGMLRATGYAKLLNAKGVALVYKERDVVVNNESKALGMIGDVEGKDVLLVDDMIDTGGTIVNAADYLRKKGAKSVRASVTHGIFSGHALDKINKSQIDEIIVTDTVELKDEVISNPKITVVSVAPLLAKAIKLIHNGGSLSDLIL